ncbi:uncharacterized protein BX663DRAFT_506664, partial [Cokeromyces recurvatus]|uniref:uncharacterized protein n=1 Tax=Cokeromyces recurvatus TaxID=90255 RepID=UPI00221F6F69
MIHYLFLFVDQDSICLIDCSLSKVLVYFCFLSSILFFSFILKRAFRRLFFLIDQD